MMEAISTEVVVRKGAAQPPQHILKVEMLWINRVKKDISDAAVLF